MDIDFFKRVCSKPVINARGMVLYDLAGFLYPDPPRR